MWVKYYRDVFNRNRFYIWLSDHCNSERFAANESCWMVPGTVDPIED